MPRQRLAPGEHGRIAEKRSGGTFFATVYVRDADGRRRRVERSSIKSAEDARRTLQRHLTERRAPVADSLVTDRTTLAELFDIWIAAKVKHDAIRPQTEHLYRTVWARHGLKSIGALRISEFPTSRADSHIQSVATGAPSQGGYLRVILFGMFALAVRFDVLAVNPVAGTRTAKSSRKPARAVTPVEFEAIRTAVASYARGRDGVGGPRPGRLLPAFVELLVATGARPGEVLAIRWEDVDLLADPPTVTITGTLIDHGRIEGKSLHRQELRKHGAPPHTVILPRFGIEALTGLVGQTGMTGPVFANRDGGWVSLANMRRSLRAALPDELRWCTPHSFRRTAGTVVRDKLGVEAAQQQLGHAHLATTEGHYVQRRTVGPDVRAALDEFAAQATGNDNDEAGER